MALIGDWRSQHSSEMKKYPNYNLKQKKRDACKRGQTQRPVPGTSRNREHISPLFIVQVIAAAMGIRFIVMTSVWSAIFFTLLLNQEDPVSSVEGYCGPCPKNWICYRNTCYQFFNESKNWYQSQASCMSQNSSLLKIYSKEDQDFFKLVKSYHWMGLIQIPENGSWQWEDGSTFSPNQLSFYIAFHTANGIIAFWSLLL